MTRHPFEYAAIRVVPRIERGEAINAGVLLYCRGLDYLGARVHLDEARLHALDPRADADGIARVLAGAGEGVRAGPRGGAPRRARRGRRTGAAASAA